MPVLKAGFDHDDVTWVQQQLVTIPVHHGTTPAHPEQKLAFVVRVPVRARAFLKCDPVKPDRLTVVATQKPLHRRGEYKVVWVSRVVGRGRPVDVFHARFGRCS